MSRKYLLATALCMATACTPAASPKPGPATDPGDGVPPNMRPLVEREVELLPAETHTSEDERVSFSAAGTLVTPVETEDGETYYVGLDIGTPSPVRCFIYDKPIDLASTIVDAADDLFAEIEETIGAIAAKQVAEVNADNASRASILEASWVLGIESEEGVYAAQIKVFAGIRDEQSVLCYHAVEPGYRVAFAAVARQVLESFSIDEEEPVRPFYEEIYVASVGDAPLGVTQVKMFRLGDGTTQVEVINSMLALMSPSVLAAHDNFTISVETADGDLIAKQIVEARGDDVTTNLELVQIAQREWSVSGTYQEKPYETTIEAAQIRSTMGYARDLRTLIAVEGVGGTATTAIWDGMDPSRLIDVSLKIIDELPDDQYDAEVMLGPVQMLGVFDETGSALRVSVKARDTEVTIKRVYRNGEF
jgi:hypothetical protein